MTRQSATSEPRHAHRCAW